MAIPAHARTLVTRILVAALWMALPAYILFVAMQTTFVEGVYIATIRNMYFGCMEFVDQRTAYRMKPGSCALDNIEYRTTMTHDRAGFRNDAETSAPRVAVLGDSHAYGHGVNDGETFAALLGRSLRVPVRNLALPAFATRRELEALKAHGLSADIIVLQYCDNDIDENLPSLDLPEDAYQRLLRGRMAAVMSNYSQTKGRSTFAQGLQTLNYAAQGLIAARLFRLSRYAPDESALPREADAFARLMGEYRHLLAGKTVIVLESSGWGRNRKGFAEEFSKRLRQVPDVDWVVLDSSALLGRADYFRLDDHLNAAGHAQLASALTALLSARLSASVSGGHPPGDPESAARRDQ